ncbi:MAG: Holliday junction resolvase [Desulfurococcales archaeon]|nr:Holliday junction resolvase [Desulfurococcales archaeon]
MGYEMYYRGKRAEYDLGRRLLRHGFFVMRAPGSGRRSKRFRYPDLLAIRKGRILLFEVKLRKKRETIIIPWKQYENLRYAASLSGGEPYIAVYVQEDKEWYFFKLEELEEQVHEKGKRYLITIAMYDRAHKFEEIIE